MTLTLRKTHKPVAENGDYIEYRFEATATPEGYASEIPARGALLSTLTGTSWSDSDYLEPQLVSSHRKSPQTTLKIRVSLVYRGYALYKGS